MDFASAWYAAKLVAPVTKVCNVLTQDEGYTLTQHQGLTRKLVYLTDSMHAEDTPQKQAVMTLIRDIGTYMGLAATPISIEDLWNSAPPEEAQGQSLHDFLHEVRHFPPAARFLLTTLRSVQALFSTPTTTVVQSSVKTTASSSTRRHS